MNLTSAPLPSFRMGEGWDCHQLVEGRPLWLGGILIPHDKGLFGHSDADVLLHAITDALLGAAGMSDIGTLFPTPTTHSRGQIRACCCARPCIAWRRTAGKS